MQDLNAKMTIGMRIKRLRHERGWTQGQCALKIKAHQKQISKYERDVSMPSSKLLIRMAKIFNVSIDYLVFNDRESTYSMDIADRELVQKITEIDKLSEQDKIIVKGVLDTFIVKNRFQRLASENQEITK
ncbi:MAG: helix-turn-helix transcriptional regulator [Bacteroidetes bacterium]|nr:helix-turn-helix transcriptional regulator [Bacteroidota bacterium]